MARLDLLIMPSAVAPSSDTPYQALTDSKIRLRQTVTAIKKWCRQAEKHDFRIIVADNTHFASRIISSLPDRVLRTGLVEIIDVPELTREDVSRGKGAGETSTLIHALNHANVPNSAIVAKVNARYFTTNGIFLIDQLLEGFDFAAWPRPRMDSVDTTFFAGTSQFLKEVFPKVYYETDDMKELFVENLYADFTINSKNCKFERFSYCPAIKGQSGTTGSMASPFNEARIVSHVVRARDSLRRALPYIRPKYQRRKSIKLS